MTNQITNEYGAFLGPAITKIEPAVKTLEDHVRNLCKELEPFEIQLLGAYLTLCMSGLTAEIQILRGIAMRKQERSEANELRSR